MTVKHADSFGCKIISITSQTQKVWVRISLDRALDLPRQ